MKLDRWLPFSVLAAGVSLLLMPVVWLVFLFAMLLIGHRDGTGLKPAREYIRDTVRQLIHVALRRPLPVELREHVRAPVPRPCVRCGRPGPLEIVRATRQEEPGLMRVVEVTACLFCADDARAKATEAAEWPRYLVDPAMLPDWAREREGLTHSGTSRTTTP